MADEDQGPVEDVDAAADLLARAQAGDDQALGLGIPAPPKGRNILSVCVVLLCAGSN